MSLHLWQMILHDWISSSSPKAWFQHFCWSNSGICSAFTGQISTHRLQLSQTCSNVLSGSSPASHKTAPSQIMLPNSGVIRSECRPIVPRPAACAACFNDMIERYLPVFLSHWLSFAGIGTHTISDFSISIQKSSAMASTLGRISYSCIRNRRFAYKCSDRKSATKWNYRFTCRHNI